LFSCERFLIHAVYLCALCVSVVFNWLPADKHRDTEDTEKHREESQVSQHRLDVLDTPLGKVKFQNRAGASAQPGTRMQAT
jgi:hypothetical protein